MIYVRQKEYLTMMFAVLLLLSVRECALTGGSMKRVTFVTRFYAACAARREFVCIY